MAETSRTPAAEWRESSEKDPHAGKYDGERAQLCMGDMSDDVLANAVFMFGDGRYHQPRPEDIVAGKSSSSIAYLTAAKERIRWLSRTLVRMTSRQGMQTAQDLREKCAELRRKPIPLEELIPLMQRAADLLDAQATATPVPAGIYYRAESDNFYSITHRVGMGDLFYMQWKDRRADFPLAIVDPELNGLAKR